MADESDQLSQDDIESLFAGPPAAGDAAPAKPSDPAPTAAGGGAAASDDPNDQLAQGDIEALFQQAEDALASVSSDAGSNDAASVGASPFKLKDFASAPATTEAATIDLLSDVELDVSIELGRTHMHLEEVLKLRTGAVVPLDKLAGDPVDVFVNGRLVARGEILVLNDNFCIRVAELLAGEPNAA